MLLWFNKPVDYLLRARLASFAYTTSKQMCERHKCKTQGNPTTWSFKTGEMESLMGYSLWLIGINTERPPSVQSCSIHVEAQCMAARCCTPESRLLGGVSLWSQKSWGCGARCWSHCTETHRIFTHMWRFKRERKTTVVCHRNTSIRLFFFSEIIKKLEK